MPHQRRVLVGIALGAAVTAAGLAAPAPTSARILASAHDSAMRTAGAPATFASTVSGGPAAAVGAPPARSEGQRMQLLRASRAPDRVVNKVYSSNWSGLVRKRPAGVIDGAAGQWIVPTVKRQSTRRYSSTWVGVDGFVNGNLIQTGTEQDTRSAGSDRYYAWAEVLPAAAEVIGNPTTGTPAPVKPGDKIDARVSSAGGHTWTIYERDVTQRWYFEQNFAYHGPGTSAEWIEEAPTVNGKPTALADFGKVQVSRTAIYTDGPDGLGWYTTTMSDGNKIAMRRKGVIRAVPSSALPTKGSVDGQRFTDTYK